ncbi:MAG: ABC transporter substrate-binding protein [Phycisphaerae bacterium]
MSIKHCFTGAVIAAVVLLMGCVAEQPEPPAKESPVQELVVLTPHHEGIRLAFELGFRDWHMRTHNKEVSIRWLVYGTPQCMKYVEDCYTSSGELAPSFMPDVVFGGSMRDHLSLQSRGWTLPMELPARDDVPETIADVPTACPDGSCVATGLSTFGMLVNTQACSERGIAPPTSWEDLADSRFFGWLAVADPGKSGTSRECLMLILQKHGWKKGWSIIMRILGNARTLVGRSGVALNQVESGESLATFAINFDAMARADGSSYQLSYVEPAGATEISPDGASALSASRNPKVAQAFVNFLVSERGQQILGLRSDYLSLNSPTLYHYPISQSIYEEDRERLAVPGNPLLASAMLDTDEVTSVAQHRVMPMLIRAACGGQHIQLQRIWEAMLAKGAPGTMTAVLFQPPATEDEIKGMADQLPKARLDEMEQMQAGLIAKMREVYDQTAKMVGM